MMCWIKKLLLAFSNVVLRCGGRKAFCGLITSLLMSLYLYTVNFTHLFVPLCFSITDGLPPADQALVR